MYSGGELTQVQADAFQSQVYQAVSEKKLDEEKKQLLKSFFDSDYYGSVRKNVLDVAQDSELISKLVDPIVDFICIQNINLDALLLGFHRELIFNLRLFGPIDAGQLPQLMPYLLNMPYSLTPSDRLLEDLLGQCTLGVPSYLVDYFLKLIQSDPDEAISRIIKLNKDASDVLFKELLKKEDALKLAALFQLPRWNQSLHDGVRLACELIFRQIILFSELKKLTLRQGRKILEIVSANAGMIPGKGHAAEPVEKKPDKAADPAQKKCDKSAALFPLFYKRYITAEEFLKILGNDFERPFYASLAEQNFSSDHVKRYKDFFDSEYCQFLNEHIFKKIDSEISKIKNQNKDALMQMEQARGKLAQHIKNQLDQLKANPAIKLDILLSQLHVNLLKEVKEIANQKFLNDCSSLSLTDFFRGLLGVLLAAPLLFFPIILSSKYRLMFFTTPAKQMVCAVHDNLKTSQFSRAGAVF